MADIRLNVIHAIVNMHLIVQTYRPIGLADRADRWLELYDATGSAQILLLNQVME